MQFKPLTLSLWNDFLEYTLIIVIQQVICGDYSYNWEPISSNASFTHHLGCDYCFYLNFNKNYHIWQSLSRVCGSFIHILKGACYSTRLCFNRSAFQMYIHFKVCGYIILVIINHRSADQTRTGTDLSVQQILSLPWLPLHHCALFLLFTVQ